MEERFTLNYWENVYQQEKINYEELSVPLEEWFEENCERIVTWIENKFDEKKKDITILDIGCGNGMFLYHLLEKGFTNLYGFDYSPAAIELCKSLFKDHPVELHILDIYNITKEIENTKLDTLYDLLNDKGTFDIFFMKKEEQLYFDQISHFFRKGIMFIITSCNACKEELLKIVKDFNNRNTQWNLTLEDEILYETISFGGKSGQLITTLIFKCL